VHQAVKIIPEIRQTAEPSNGPFQTCLYRIQARQRFFDQILVGQQLEFGIEILFFRRPIDDSRLAFLPRLQRRRNQKLRAVLLDKNLSLRCIERRAQHQRDQRRRQCPSSGANKDASAPVEHLN
jgi:hypothetical protein